MSEHKMGGAPRYLSLADRVVGWVGHLLGQVLAPQLAGVIHSGLFLTLLFSKTVYFIERIGGEKS